MSQEIIKILSSHIDKDILKDLVDTYNSVQDAYFDEDYEGTLSKSGKFVENIFRCLYYIVSKTKLTEIKRGQINELFEKLEKSDSSKSSETIRIVIPRVAITSYTMRSKMGSEHVKTIKPDFIDARFTISSCDWMMSELLRVFHGRDSTKIDTIIQSIKSKRQPKLDSFEIQLAEKIDNIPIPDLILIIFRTAKSQTKAQIIDTLKKIGRDISSWFKGGNFNSRLLRSGFIIEDGKNDSGESMFSLTIRGVIKAEKLIDKLRTESASS